MALPSNYYFDNEKVESWIIEYLDYNEETRYTNVRALHLREKIILEIGNIVNAIIYKHKFIVWENYDDLYQEAIEACMKALDKFNPNFITSKGEKATAFNYFSLTAKRCLKFYTIRDKKNRDNYDIDDYSYNLSYSFEEAHNSKRLISEAFIKELKNILIEDGHKKFIPLVDILGEYLEKIGNYNKRDFFRFSKSFGWSPNLIRKFLKIVESHKEKFYTLEQSIYEK